MKIVAPLWCHPSDIPVEGRLDIYMHCEPKVGTRCINTRYMKKVAEINGRAIRKANTLKGYANWSECVGGEWHMFRMPLRFAYAAKIDKFDATGKRFDLPATVKSAFAKVEWKGECVENRGDPKEVVDGRKGRLAARIASGALKSRSKFREAQAPAVLARLAA